ncbi:MAG: hypothetical protein E3K37_13645 [Candidatus Kuenenia sp.]|nr:hypothetical protein [Candidatus Kuenenia hertensis]
MMTNEFFICPVCGNNKDFKIIFSSFKTIKQSPVIGIRTEESNALPNLRDTDNYIECSWCLKKYTHDVALNIGRRYMRALKRFQNKIS